VISLILSLLFSLLFGYRVQGELDLGDHGILSLWDVILYQGSGMCPLAEQIGCNLRYFPNERSLA